MDIYYIKGNILILSVIAPVVIGTYRYRSLDTGSRIFFYLAFLCMVAESLAYYTAVRFNNNLAVYNTSNIIELFLACLYINYSSAVFRRRNIGWIVAVCSLIIGIVNNFFIQSLNVITTNFLLYQAFVTIILSAISLSAFIRTDDPRHAKNEVHFWFPVILIFSWGFTYLLFGLEEFYGKSVPTGIEWTLFFVSIAANTATGLVFFYYPKMAAHVR